MSATWVPEPETLYVSVADVIVLHDHDKVMERSGDHSAPLRDLGLLEAAHARPRMASLHERADYVRQALLHAAGISQADAFVAGNKRTVYAALEVFLDLNGLELTGDVLELADQPIEVTTRTSSIDDVKDAFEAWLRERVATH